jgi:hypothetical protein
MASECSSSARGVLQRCSSASLPDSSRLHLPVSHAADVTGSRQGSCETQDGSGDIGDEPSSFQQPSAAAADVSDAVTIPVLPPSSHATVPAEAADGKEMAFLSHSWGSDALYGYKILSGWRTDFSDKLEGWALQYHDSGNYEQLVASIGAIPDREKSRDKTHQRATAALVSACKKKDGPSIHAILTFIYQTRGAVRFIDWVYIDDELITNLRKFSKYVPGEMQQTMCQFGTFVRELTGDTAEEQPNLAFRGKAEYWLVDGVGHKFYLMYNRPICVWRSLSLQFAVANSDPN